MTDELFDIVDEKDMPTGKFTTKQEAHSKGYPHRVAAVLVFRKNGAILVQEHKLMGRLLDHSVGGHVAAGEAYIDAANRETEEELGLKIRLQEIALSAPTIAKDPRPEFQGITHFYGVYKAVVSDSWQLKPTEEVDSIIEMRLDECIDLMNNNPEKFLNGFFISLSAYLDRINYPKKIRAFGKKWGEM